MRDLLHSVNDTYYYLCRLCALKCSTPGVAIFSDEGMWREVPRKIRECLHFSVYNTIMQSTIIRYLNEYILCLISNTDRPK